MPNPYEEAGKSIGRGLAHMNGEEIPADLLPAPTRVVCPVATATWDIDGYHVHATDTDRGREITLSNGHTRIAIPPGLLTQVIDAVSAAQAWEDPTRIQYASLNVPLQRARVVGALGAPAVGQ